METAAEAHESNPINDPTAARGKRRVRWYRCPVAGEHLRELNQRSDLLGFGQTLGFLGLLALNVALAIYSASHWPWYVTVVLVYWNSMCWHFLINGFHELIHDSVFRTRWLNWFFLRIFSFLGWYNHHHFWASHTEHHKYTLHPPDDGEVVLPQKVTLKDVIKYRFITIHHPYVSLRAHMRHAFGTLPQDPWTRALFPDSNEQGRRRFVAWERILVIGHLSIAFGSLLMGWWMVPIVITFPMSMGGWLHMLCNSSQHLGLSDNTPDYRLCCRTIYLNPFFQFLYWHMNYHTEHHMYAAVPCYKLGRLHRLIKHDMPHCPNGLVETWTQIAGILRRQKEDPSYQYVAEVPTRPPDRSHPPPGPTPESPSPANLADVSPSSRPTRAI